MERKFEFGIPVGIFPCVLERFRGTPSRLEELVRDIPRRVLTARTDRKWSIQEHAGHLLDLEELGEKRLREFLSQSPTLSAADMGNRKTFEAGHNEQETETILREFKRARRDLVRKLEILTESQASVVSHHPRLNKTMTVVDWVYFMSEHDDHHLARIRGMMTNQIMPSL
jgi:hypothetical protein